MRIFVPGDAAAVAVGADAVATAIQEAARGRGRSVQIVRNGSRGMIWLEPLVEVETPGGRIAYGPVDREDVTGLFEAGLLEGADHPLRIGWPEDHPFLKRQTRLTFARCGIVDPRSLDDYRAHGGGKGLERALALGPAATIEEVLQSGLRGRGGAGFPTGIKWRTVAQTRAPQKYIVCNADEGDSGTFADRMIMEGDPFVLIEGMAIAGIAVGATKGYVYIRSEYPHAVAAMDAAIARGARAAACSAPSVAGSAYAFDLEVRVGAGAYVCGEETSLLESLEGKRGQVRAKPPLPAHHGLFGRPTVINNVLSFATVPFIMAQGRGVLSAISAWAARAAPCRSSSPATSSMAACSRPRSASRSANWSTTSAAAPRPAGRCARCRSAARSAPIFRARCSTRRSTTRRSPRATG